MCKLPAEPIFNQRENPAVHGGRESDTVLSNRRRLLTETQMLSTRRLVHVSKGCVGSRHLRGSTRRAETSVPSISGRRFPRVGSATDCGVRVVRQHGNPAYGSGKCDRTDRAVRHDRLRERRPEKPGVDDSLAGGSARDSATGRSRARDETRPTDLGREGPETCSVTGRVSSCGGSLAVYGEEDVTGEPRVVREARVPAASADLQTRTRHCRGRITAVGRRRTRHPPELPERGRPRVRSAIPKECVRARASRRGTGPTRPLRAELRRAVVSAGARVRRRGRRRTTRRGDAELPRDRGQLRSRVGRGARPEAVLVVPRRLRREARYPRVPPRPRRHPRNRRPIARMGRLRLVTETGAVQ